MATMLARSHTPLKSLPFNSDLSSWKKSPNHSSHGERPTLTLNEPPRDAVTLGGPALGLSVKNSSTALVGALRSIKEH
eukprot:SAG31_NODE_2080_length_6493_cov_3.638255_2_plen_78_part_00